MPVKIAIVTSNRAEYGLLYPLIKKMLQDSFFDVTLIVTGTHLSEQHGKTIDFIKKDGLDIHHIVDLNVDGDTEHDICCMIGKGIEGFSTIFRNNKLDGILVLGDRFELWAICIPAVIHKIPIIHLHGGEITQGAIDDMVRHSISKMASIHFPSIDLHAKRIVQMGENPERVYVVGAIGLDNIKEMVLMDVAELSAYTGIDFNSNIALMTYHPVTLDQYKEASNQIEEVMEALISFNIVVLITMPNADTGGKTIFEVIQKYIHLYPQQFRLIKNLGQRGYLSAMKYCKFMIGNSSSGIIESPSFKIPVINIGDRQNGRHMPQNVISVQCEKRKIIQAIQRAMSTEFYDTIRDMKNPYGDGKTAHRIVALLKSFDWKDNKHLLKKGFHDIANIFNTKNGI